MKVSQAIKYLRGLDPDDHIIIAWWERDMFPAADAEHWEGNSEYVEGKVDWSYVHNQMTDILREED